MRDRRDYLIRAEAARIKNARGAIPSSKARCITAVAKQVLLDGIYFYNGNRINPVAKSIGAGVWEVSHKEGE
jgi:hypothetical protein